MTGFTTLLGLAVLAAACGAIWWLRRRRAEALMGELGRALGLAAEAQQVHWRLQRRYTDDLSTLARARRELAPFVEDPRDARWVLGVSEDGSRFDLAILALPLAAPLRLVRRRTLPYRRLLTAHGYHGLIAYDSFAEEKRYRPRAALDRPPAAGAAGPRSIGTGSIASAGSKPRIWP